MAVISVPPSTPRAPEGFTGSSVVGWRNSPNVSVPPALSAVHASTSAVEGAADEVGGPAVELLGLLLLHPATPADTAKTTVHSAKIRTIPPKNASWRIFVTICQLFALQCHLPAMMSSEATIQEGAMTATRQERKPESMD